MSNQRAMPYCTVKGFRRALDALRARPAPTVDRSSLVERGLSPHAVYPVLGALRYLRLIDRAGRPLPSLAAFLAPSDVDGRRALVEEAYADVLRRLRLPVEDREEVDRLLIEGFGCAPGVAAFCSTFLLWLLAESGMPVARLSQSRRGRPPAYLACLSEAAQERLSDVRDEALPSAFGAGERALPTEVPTRESGAAS